MLVVDKKDINTNTTHDN